MGPARRLVERAGEGRGLDEGLDEHVRDVVALGPVVGQLSADQGEDVRAQVRDDDPGQDQEPRVTGEWELEVGTVTLDFEDATFAASTLGGVAGTTISWSSHSSTLADDDTVKVRILSSTLAAPANLAATPGDGQVVLSWDAPASNSGITRHEYRYKTGDGSFPSTWTAIANSGAGGANEGGVTVTGLANGTAYTFQVRAVDATGEGPTAEIAGGLDVVVTIESANVDGDAIVGLDNVQFKVSRAGSTADGIHVSVTLTQDRAFLADANLSRTAVIMAGNSEGFFRIFTNSIDTSAGSGTLTATVATGTGYKVGTPASAAVAIWIADPPGTVRLEQAAYDADEPGTLTVDLIAEMAPGLPAPDGSISVTFSTRDGTATGGADFAAVSGRTVVFERDDFRTENGVVVARKAQTLTILDDRVPDDGEQFTVVLSRASTTRNFDVVTADKSAECPDEGCTATVTISDDDPVPVFERQPDRPSKPVVTLDGDTADTVLVSWTAPTNPAHATRDYAIYYNEHPARPTGLAVTRSGEEVEGPELNAFLHNLKPDTAYRVQIVPRIPPNRGGPPSPVTEFRTPRSQGNDIRLSLEAIGEEVDGIVRIPRTDAVELKIKATGLWDLSSWGTWGSLYLCLRYDYRGGSQFPGSCRWLPRRFLVRTANEGGLHRGRDEAVGRGDGDGAARGGRGHAAAAAVPAGELRQHALGA